MLLELTIKPPKRVSIMEGKYDTALSILKDLKPDVIDVIDNVRSSLGVVSVDTDTTFLWTIVFKPKQLNKVVNVIEQIDAVFSDKGLPIYKVSTIINTEDTEVTVNAFNTVTGDLLLNHKIKVWDTRRAKTIKVGYLFQHNIK